MRRVVTPRWAAYGEAVAGQGIVDVGVDHAGHPAMLTTDREGLPPSITGFYGQLSRRDAVPVPRRFRVVVFAPDGPRVVPLDRPTGWLSRLHPLPGGRWLLVPAAAAADATLFTADAAGRLGEPIRLAAPSHGLAGVVPADDGHLWSHYDDRSAWQGVGLQCHDPAGRLVHEVRDLPGAAAAGYGGYTYALTPGGGSTMYAYVYDRHFALFALDPRRVVRAWDRLPIEAASAFAIAGDHALFGPAGGGPDRLTLVDLAGEPGRRRTIETPAGPLARYPGKLPAERLAPVDGRGRPVGALAYAARGGTLWLFARDAVYGAAVAELARPADDQAPALGRDEPTGLEPTLGGGWRADP